MPKKIRKRERREGGRKERRVITRKRHSQRCREGRQPRFWRE